LDLPEVTLVAILDADKAGFLRSEQALIQTIGRTARHIEGRVIMYADRVTDSMKRAIDKTERRRKKQAAYNHAHNIEPRTVVKEVRDLTMRLTGRKVAEPTAPYATAVRLPEHELRHLILDLEEQMREAAQQLEFEKAAALRDQILELNQQSIT